MKMDMCSGAIVCHPLGSSSRCGFRGQFSSSTCRRDISSFSSLFLAWNGRHVSYSPAFGNIPPKLSTWPLRHAERVCEHWCKGSPYHWLSTQMFLHLNTYWASSILMPATNQEMLPDLRPLSFSFLVSFSLMSACDGTALEGQNSNHKSQ